MPRKNQGRRFGGYPVVVSQIVVDEESKHIAREIDDLLVLSTVEVRKFTDERYRKASESWQVLQQQIASLSERDAEALRAVLFRDVLHVIECCRSFFRLHRTESSPRIIPHPTTVDRHQKFSEWLFQ